MGAQRTVILGPKNANGRNAVRARNASRLSQRLQIAAQDGAQRTVIRGPKNADGRNAVRVRCASRLSQKQHSSKLTIAASWLTCELVERLNATVFCRQHSSNGNRLCML